MFIDYNSQQQLNGNSPQNNHRFDTVLIKTLARFFIKIDKFILKFVWKFKGPKVVKIIPKKNNKIGAFILSNSSTYSKATVIKKSTVFTS